MPDAQRDNIQSSLATLMTWTQYVSPITNNAVSLFPTNVIRLDGLIIWNKAAMGRAPVDTHGSRGLRDSVPRSTRYGQMYGMGWHAAQERGKTLAAYAVKAKTEAGLLKSVDYTQMTQTTLILSLRLQDTFDDIPKVSSLYRSHLNLIFPGGATRLQEVADKYVGLLLIWVTIE